MSADCDLPRFAAWRHVGARDGFEVVFLEVSEGGIVARGHTAAVERGDPFSVDYEIELDPHWRTRRGRVTGRSLSGSRAVELESDGHGSWRVDGAPAPDLAGCLDLDLEASALTNALPVHRLGLAPGRAADAPAAYVRALDLSVGRLDQRYRRRDDDGDGRDRYDYAAPAFEFRCRLAYDASGLVVDYPGLAVRVGSPSSASCASSADSRRPRRSGPAASG